MTEERMKEIARKKGMKTRQEVETATLSKIKKNEKKVGKQPWKGKGKGKGKHRPPQKQITDRILKTFLNKPVKVVLINNTILEGVFKETDQFTVLIVPNNSTPILLWKHGLLSLVEVKT